MATTLFKGGKVVNVFLDRVEETNVLVEDGKIIGVGDYEEADEIVDVNGKILCPGFIDGHIHIESTMLLPEQLARVTVPHGTTAIVADPHEIANVSGRAGISYMIEKSKGLPMDVFFALPSCVPATPFDEAGAVLNADKLESFYANDKVISLGEVMNYPGVIADDAEVLEKIERAKSYGKVINGHAPMLTGKDLDKYISNGITDDHECSSFEEAAERIAKGQNVLVRYGTSARNLDGLIELFEEPYSRHCMLVTDDKHPADLVENGHIDAIIRRAASLGKSPLVGIRMATIQAARYYGMTGIGAIAPGYTANILVLNSLEECDVNDVYFKGQLVSKDKKICEIPKTPVDSNLDKAVRRSIYMDDITADDFAVEPDPKHNHVIGVIPGELITEDVHVDIDFSKNNGIDLENDVLKIAVCERHNHTGHIGIGFIKGIGIKSGAIVSSVSHDSHNLIVIGTNEEDMAFAVNTCKEMGGGLLVVESGHIVASLPLPMGGLMSEESAEVTAEKNKVVREAVHALGAPRNIEPFMNMAFVSLTVIPHLKITTLGMVDVDKQELIK